MKKPLLFVQRNCRQTDIASDAALLYLSSFKQDCMRQILIKTNRRSLTFNNHFKSISINKTAALEILNYLCCFSLSLPICLQFARFQIVFSLINVEHKNTLSTISLKLSPFIRQMIAVAILPYKMSKKNKTTAVSVISAKTRMSQSEFFFQALHSHNYTALQKSEFNKPRRV